MGIKLDGQPRPDQGATKLTETSVDLGRESFGARVAPERLGTGEVSKVTFTIINPEADRFQDISTTSTLSNSTNGEGPEMRGDKILDRDGITGIQGSRFATSQSRATETEVATAADADIPVARVIGPRGVSIVHLN